MQELCSEESIFKFSGRTLLEKTQSTQIFSVEFVNNDETAEICLLYSN